MKYCIGISAFLVMVIVPTVVAVGANGCEEGQAVEHLPERFLGSWDPREEGRGPNSTKDVSWGEAPYLDGASLLIDRPTEARDFAEDEWVFHIPLTMERGPTYRITEVCRVSENRYAVTAETYRQSGSREPQVMQVELRMSSEGALLVEWIAGDPGLSGHDQEMYLRSGPE